MDEPNSESMSSSGDDRKIRIFCEQFEAAWSTSRPRIEKYLSDWDGSDRKRLLRELLLKEIEILLALGEEIPVADYESRFKADVETVHEVLSTTQPLRDSSAVETTLAPQPNSMALPETTAGLNSAKVAPDDHATRIGRYEILGEIARGGMGCVLRAYDESLDRHLAIKVGLPREKTKSQEADASAVDELQLRFLTEAQVTGKLQHPGIPPVHERGDFDDGRPFFAMKLVEGQTLAELLKHRKDPAEDLSRFLTIFSQICETIAYAHSRDIVHRDLKTANIMVGQFGEVQVMDWGLAKQLSSTQSHRDAHTQEEDLRLGQSSALTPFETMDGSIMGTPAYMAPEQARGEIEEVDKRSDVFGLGALLCEILTGQPPFTGANGPQVLQAAVEGDWSSARLKLEKAELDDELLQLTTRCLEKDPSRRPPDGSKVNAAVRAYLDDVRERLKQADIDRASSEVKYAEERKRRQVERQRNRLWFSLSAVVAIAMLAGLAMFAWYQRTRASQIAEEVRLEEQRLARQERIVGEVNISLDRADQTLGKLLADLHNDREASRLLSDIDGWSARVQSAAADVNNADKVAATDKALLPAETKSRLTETHTKLSKAEDDYQLARQLDKIRLDYLSIMPNERKTIGEYKAAMRETILDIDELTPETIVSAAEKIQSSDIRVALVAAVDSWSMFARMIPPDDERDKMIATLAKVAVTVDPDPWRERLRFLYLSTSRIAEDKQVAAKLVAELKVEDQSPHILCFLAQQMAGLGLDVEPVLNAAMLQYPNDFYLSNQFSISSSNPTARLHAARNLIAIRPKSAVAWNNLGVRLFNGSDDMAAAEKAYRRALDLESQYSAAHANLSSVYYITGRYDESIKAAQTAVDLDEENFRSWNNLARGLYFKGRFDESAEASQKALSLAKQSHFYKSSPTESPVATILYGLGQAERARKNYKQAIKALQESIRLTTDKTLGGMGWEELSLCFVNQQKFDDALEAIEKSLKLYPDGSSAWLLSADLHQQLGGLKKAEAAYRRAAELNPKNINIWLRLSGCLLRQRRPADAIPALRAALAIDPKRPSEWMNLGTALAETGDIAQATDALNRAVELDPRFKARSFSAIGNTYGQRGQWKKAAEQFEKAVEAASSSKASSSVVGSVEWQQTAATRLGAFLSLAAVRRFQGDLEAAAAVLQKAKLNFPNNRSILAELAIVKKFQSQLPAALGDLPNIRRLPPEEQLGLLAIRGLACLKRDRLEDAAEAARLMSGMELATQQTHFDAAGILARCGESISIASDNPDPDKVKRRKALHQESLAMLEKAIAAGWDNFDRIQYDDSLRSLRGLPEFQRLSRADRAKSDSAK